MSALRSLKFNRHQLRNKFLPLTLSLSFKLRKPIYLLICFNKLIGPRKIYLPIIGWALYGRFKILNLEIEGDFIRDVNLIRERGKAD